MRQAGDGRLAVRGTKARRVPVEGIRGPVSRPRRQQEIAVRKQLAVWITVALVLFALSKGRASERDETVMTVQVSSADHELIEGYFTLGDGATVIAKPGTPLYGFLARQRGRKVKVVLTEAAGPELSRLER
jgi:hypothetical protein